MVAVYHGSSEVVDTLLRAKADVNIATEVKCYSCYTYICHNSDFTASAVTD